MKVNTHNFNILFLLALPLLLFSCSDFSEGKGKAEEALTNFHHNFNSSSFELIYDLAHKDLKSSTSKKEFLEFMAVVRKKLGKNTNSKNIGWNVNSHNLKTYVSLTQQTTFQEGEGTESFVFRIENEQAQLLNYNINSRDLIMK